MYCAVYQGSARTDSPVGLARLTPWDWKPKIPRARPSFSEFEVRRENHRSQRFAGLTQNDNAPVRYRSLVDRKFHATTTPISGGVGSEHMRSSTTQSVAFGRIDGPSVARGGYLPLCLESGEMTQ